jgi:hypothetical protein
MQGKGTEFDWKFFKQLSMFGIVFISVITILLYGCEEKPKHKQPVLVPQYQEGDIVYLKPDSTIGVIGDVTMYISSIGYRIGYKNNQGVIEYHDFTETQIYSKKQ